MATRPGCRRMGELPTDWPAHEHCARPWRTDRHDRRRCTGRRVRHLRHHRRPRQGDDLSLALPARAPRAARLPDRGRRRSTTGQSTTCASTPASASRIAGRRSTTRSFDRFAARLSYVSGDFGDDETYQRVGREIGDASSPVFYLEIPPSLFGMVIKGLAGAGLTDSARVVVEKPFGHDVASAAALDEEVHQYLDESQLYRIDHFLGQDGPRRDPLPAVREHDVRADLEPQLRRLGPDHDGRGASGSRTAATSTTRSAPCATSSSTT